MGWKGHKVRNADGRTGKISDEFIGFGFRFLTIRVDGGEKDHVQLNIDGPDSGTPGWEWWCENLENGPSWLPLGDFEKERSRTY